jgi:hypothetical protein
VYLRVGVHGDQARYTIGKTPLGTGVGEVVNCARAANPKDKIVKEAKVDSGLHALIAQSWWIVLATDGSRPQHASNK